MFEVIGIERVDFNAPDGNRIVGTRLYLTCNKNRVVGKACESCFIKDSISTTGIEVGDQIEIFYNKYGKVSDVKNNSLF